MWGLPNVYSNCLTGPSSYAVKEGYTQAERGTSLVDDIVSRDERNLLLRLTEGSLSLWPNLKHFQDFEHWHGYWNPECEKWFQAIYKGIMSLSRQPLGRTGWEKGVKQHMRSSDHPLEPGSMLHAESVCRRLRLQFPNLLTSHGLPPLRWEKDSYSDDIQTVSED
ncbi:hypothetical protein JAAARDRAFT_201127 [Jaapia argillacea MUCL 33604]|uniref:Uncharacterized protein n=1 Tax=Jaapia argillacea MUCL 33604 TaxID=933084 RepID=A0A067P2X8_9AGAM|nr:hypothetical protein JAAARDRAFT_201127 [Jaapia argillacea MUCL 33604]